MNTSEVSYSKSRRLKNQILNVVTNPYNVIVLITIILLLYLIVVPLFEMIKTTFTMAQRDSARAGVETGAFTLYYWQRLLASKLSGKMLFQPLLNSLLVGFAVSFFAILLGSVLAWLMVRTDLPCKGFFSLAVIIPYMIPSWAKAQAWLTMFKTERIGGTPGFMTSLGISTPEWLAYGPVAIIIVLTLHYYAYAYLLVSAALNSINSELEEMGEIQGAGKARILKNITLPLVLPAMLSAIILTFSKAIGTFGVINYLGSKVNFVTLSSQLYSNNKSQNTQTAFAMAIIMIAIASLSVFINQKLIGSRKSYATIGGKGGRSTLLRLGGAKPIITALLFVFFAAVDPAQYHRQGADVGSQYQSGVYWIDPADEETVRAVAAIEAAPRPDFCTELKPLENFYGAEEYHQRYLEKNPGGYCHISPATNAMLAQWDYDDAGYTRPAAFLLREKRDALRRTETLRELGYSE